jgi:hypothetical protein
MNGKYWKPVLELAENSPGKVFINRGPQAGFCPGPPFLVHKTGMIRIVAKINMHLTFLE